MSDKKRKASDRDDLVEEPGNKIAKTNIDQYKTDNSVLVLTFESDNDDLYHVPQLYTFPQTLLKCYKYVIKNLDTRKNAYRPVSKEVFKTIEHLEDVILLCVENGKDSDNDPITYMDVWINAIEYWKERKLVKFLPDSHPINDHVNITIVKCVKVLEI
jgi:hypothetical protein